MTNREWLESLSDNELAEILNNEPCGKRCFVTKAYGNCLARIMTNSCNKQIVRWLQSEHKDEE